MSQESSIKNFEWHRERALRERKNPNIYSGSRVEWNMREIEKKHGKKASKEMVKEFNASRKAKQKMYFV